MIGIIDYGMGNVGSLVNMVERLGFPTTIIKNPDNIDSASKLILPGVGSFDNGINRLKECDLWDTLNTRVTIGKIPILCICLGMQLITAQSEEGKLKGFGWIRGECMKFSFSDPAIKVPHMGWNSVIFNRNSNLRIHIPENPRYYFVHSYFVRCVDELDILATTAYNLEFVSVIQKDNIYATQFHPEKSHKYGMGLIKSFIESC